jgi:hypothetical protein
VANSVSGRDPLPDRLACLTSQPGRSKSGGAFFLQCEVATCVGGFERRHQVSNFESASAEHEGSLVRLYGGGLAMKIPKMSRSAVLLLCAVAVF